MKKNKIIKFILIFAIIIGGIVMSVFFVHKAKYSDLVAYEEKLLEIELKEYVNEAVGNIEGNLFSEEYANIRMEIKTGCEEEIVNLLTTSLGQTMDISSFQIPEYQGHELAAELKNTNVKYIFTIFREGKRAKTRSIELYVTEDRNHKMYVYIFG